MNELFTIPEINLMCIFGISNRGELISELASVFENFTTGDAQSDAEIKNIANDVLEKLAVMSDEDFAALEIYPEYNETDYYETEV